jgi:peptidoglycan hydrolase CwlO-like protein
MDTNAYISLGTLVTLISILKPMWAANKELESRLSRMESEINHLKNESSNHDKLFEKLTDKIEDMSKSINKIENSITRIETLLNQRNIP